jgi:hypothetical protein
MSDHSAQQTLAMPMIEGARAAEPLPRQFLTLGLVIVCLAFWTGVILAVAHIG